jgi:hypothetical protein
MVQAKQRNAITEILEATTVYFHVLYNLQFSSFQIFEAILREILTVPQSVQAYRFVRW